MGSVCEQTIFQVECVCNPDLLGCASITPNYKYLETLDKAGYVCWFTIKTNLQPFKQKSSVHNYPFLYLYIEQVQFFKSLKSLISTGQSHMSVKIKTTIFLKN